MFANATEIFQSLLRDLLTSNNVSEEQMDDMVLGLAKRLSVTPVEAVTHIGKLLMVGTSGERPS